MYMYIQALRFTCNIHFLALMCGELDWKAISFLHVTTPCLNYRKFYKLKKGKGKGAVLLFRA